MSELSSNNKSLRTLFLEALSLMSLAIILGSLWNHFSISKIQYRYDYFPHTIATKEAEHNPSSSSDWKQRESITQAELRKLISNNHSEKIILVDARRAELFDKGHIPEAIQFNRYRLAHDLPRVLPPCLAADLIIIYCQGGKCEDSHIAKKILTQSGVSSEVILILEGGYLKWVKNEHEIIK